MIEGWKENEERRNKVRDIKERRERITKKRKGECRYQRHPEEKRKEKTTAGDYDERAINMKLENTHQWN